MKIHIIHGDIKPKNIAADPKKRILILIDSNFTSQDKSIMWM